MAYELSFVEFDQVLQAWSRDYKIYGPRRVENGGAFSDTDNIRYGEIACLEDLEYRDKSLFSYKEVLFPVTETLFDIRGDKLEEVDYDQEPGYLVFLRSCDRHSVERLDKIFLENGDFQDPYYKRRREKTKFLIMECEESYDSCFCVAMGTNRVDEYSLALKIQGERVYLDIRDPDFALGREENSDYSLGYVKANKREEVILPRPDKIGPELFEEDFWKDYDRCIACGRCNFSCPSCTCFSTSDIYYSENKSRGERRRTWSSCHVDNFTTMAGGGEFRSNHGARMRFKTLHKIYDFNKRFNMNMCVGCGRCDDRCPEYISFGDCITRVSEKVGRLEDESL